MKCRILFFKHYIVSKKITTEFKKCWVYKLHVLTAIQFFQRGKNTLGGKPPILDISRYCQKYN